MFKYICLRNKKLKKTTFDQKRKLTRSRPRDLAARVTMKNYYRLEIKIIYLSIYYIALETLSNVTHIFCLYPTTLVEHRKWRANGWQKWL